MTRPVGKLKAAGFERVRSSGERRRYIDPQGRNVSYWEAFKRATGRTLAEAVVTPRKFNKELSTARDIRRAARDGKLVELKILTPRQQESVAGQTLRTLTRGHYMSSATSKGMLRYYGHDVKPVERRTTYAKLLEMLQTESVAKPDRGQFAPGRDGMLAWRREFIRWTDANSPYGKKADLLRAMGRKTDYEYNVGETPPGYGRGGRR